MANDVKGKPQHVVGPKPRVVQEGRRTPPGWGLRDEVRLFGNMEITGDARKFISGRKVGAECTLEGEEE